MKKLITLTLAGAVMLAGAAELVRDGKPVATIELGSMPDSAAVKDLQYHFKKLCGSELSVGEKKAPTRIVLEKFDGDGFRLCVKGPNVTIYGENGIYEFLRRLGCDWVMPGEIGEVIPSVKNLSIPDMDVTERPSFAVRSPWLSGGARYFAGTEKADFDLWKRRMKLTERDTHPLVMQGGHVWEIIIRNNQKEFDTHPEMYALVRELDGTLKRKGPQLETTHPRVIELFCEYIRDQFRKNKWPKDKLVCIGVGPSDGGGYSISKESMDASAGRIDPISGNEDITDLQILLINQIFDKIGKEFPNLHLGFYLYSCHADYPARYKVHPRTVIVIADITYSRLHSTLEPVSTRAYYKKILDQWAKEPIPKFFRGYNWNLAEHFLPYSKLKMWADDLPLYHKMGVLGVYNESIAASATLAPSNYYEAILLWNVNADMKATLAQFCRKAYGDGAAPMEKYWLMLTDRQSKAQEQSGSFHAFPLMYDKKFVADSLRLIDEAENAAKLPAEKERIRLARIPAAQLGDFLEMRRLMNDFKFAEAEKIFIRTQKEKEDAFKTGKGAVASGASRMMVRFFQSPLEKSRFYSSAPYRIVFQFPDRLKTIFDPYSQGDKFGLMNPEMADDDLVTTRTYESTWARQGLINLPNGSVWYRVWTPPIKEKEVGLLIPGADSVVRVWSNGKYIGMGSGFMKPMPFDLTGTLSAKQKNLIVIQVERRGNSEIGTGGLILPSFLFTGPRLPERAPAIDSNYRLLPGGEIEEIKK